MKNKIYTAIIAVAIFALPGITANAQWMNTGAGPVGTPEIIKAGDSIRLYGLGSNFSSADNGDTWIKDSIHGMGVYPNLISIEKTSSKYFGGDPYGHIYESTDGLFWTLSHYMGYTVPLPYILTDGDIVYVAVDGVGILRSPDNGGTWIMGDTGLTGNGNNMSQIVKVGSDIFISTLDGVFKSTDGGANWVQKNNGLPNSVQCNGIGYSQGALLTSGYGFGVFRSTDMGDSWLADTTGLDGYLFVGGFYTSGNIAVVGGSSCKAHFSTDGGLIWHLIAKGVGFGFEVFNDFLIDDGYLFATTSLYCLKVSLDTIGISTGIAEEKFNEQNISVYPNPVSNSLTLQIGDKNLNEETLLQVFDISGKLIREEKLSGNRIDVSALANGFYVLALTANGKMQQQKFIVQH